MIGVDTNVLVRLLVVDDEKQHLSVRDFFARRSGADPAFVSSVVLLETLWVLKRRLGYSSKAICEAIRIMLLSPEFRFQHGERLAETLASGDPSASDIADRLIAWSGEFAGCLHTVTFDKQAAKSIPAMTLLA